MRKREEGLKKRLRERILERLDYTREQSDEELWELLDELLTEDAEVLLLPVKERQGLRGELFDSLRGLDILQGLIQDPSVSEIMVNGPNHIFVERNGRIEGWDGAFESTDKLQDVIQRIVAGCNRVVNEASPIVDARLPGEGARVNVVLSPIALDGPLLTIRKFPEKPIDMEELIRRESLETEVSEFLGLLVRAKYNILISGGTGSGKTTFLNALSAFIPEEERVVTIEDSAELQLQKLPDLVRMETRNQTVEGCRPIGIRDLIRTSLRMRPDRIIVGEVRGGEAYDMLQCMNTGHDGSMTTAHANSAGDMLSRLENMVLMGMELPLSAVRRQIASGIDIIVHLGRLRDKSRRVLEIVEVEGYEEDRIRLRTLFRFGEIGQKGERIVGKLIRKEKLFHEEKLQMAGLDL